MSLTHQPIGPGSHVFLVDGSSFVFRAYFQSIRQDAKYNYRADRLPTGAVRLFCAKLFQFVREGAAGVMPTHLAIIFDKSENSFRKEIYPDYKAHRQEPPADLVPQFPLMRAAVRAFGLLPIEQDVYEADDLIATYAKLARARGADVLIVSADKDLMQLIDDKVSMYDPASGTREERRIGYNEVIEYFGVPPEKVVDVQALAGDSTDNVPGAKGIGVKTAALLINEYGDLDTLLARAGSIKQPKRREVLTDPASVALIRTSQKLVKLVDDAPLEISLDDLGLHQPDGKTLVSFLQAMEFTQLTRRAAETYGVEANEIEPDPAFVGPAGWRGRNGEVAEAPAQQAPAAPAAKLPTPEAGALTPAALAEARREEGVATKIDRSLYETVTTLERLDAWIAEAFAAGFVAMDTETTSLDPMSCDLVGVSLATAPGRACYIPLRHVASAGPDLLGGGEPPPAQIPFDDAIARLKPLLEARSVLKIAQNMKYDLLVLACCGVDVAPIEDTMLISYALDSGRNNHGLDELAKKHLGHECIPFAAVAGSGRSFIGFARVPLDKATEYAAEDADVALRLWRVLKPRLAAEHMTSVYETLERPMVGVLAAMERRGVAIDRNILSRLSGEFAQDMARLEAEIYDLAGESFNLGSPKQLGDILFGRMGLPGAKKTATGAWSTSASVLEDLAESGNTFAARILDWRQLSKLKSTYTDALPGFVNKATNRVHTSYALAATTTGRLSSSEPNLQNIPVRNEAGRKIRKAFVAEPGHALISADYSQIELRLLAHIADIPQLRQAFAEGIDIHAKTASEMFGVPVQGMPSDVRRRAKAINFGIIYGISAFGLANQLGIPREEAAAYIKRYFERFPGIRDYMDKTKRLVREQGVVTTIFGRKCHFPRIGSSNASERAFFERAAINAPIQGAAADIIRRAMARMDAALATAGCSARMLMQVHDELVFEAPLEETETTIAVVKRVMEEAPHPAATLTVPLQVEARAAQNWDEAH
ncbi:MULTISPECIES: DNA polymerase I [Methylosinus]|uniref:DNA polymerase I n=1 Tax=Methylosinus trichosporium (strain ATCC 35070 / NCIMB 11131 / UNIQEM 75 / OB3b) TaxID=595536 RepID=A0A2D2CW28_METT3|nr:MULTISPECIES: DNA polymerase I [Methylosinus]ATQ66992.1 DNA polymerase I [Methylosinus trichosporium OB3b]OBS54041.1 DNA polymerase I [Methylosinus sp. 3S-1]